MIYDCKEEQIKKFKQSGETIAQFCHRNHLNFNDFCKTLHDSNYMPTNCLQNNNNRLVEIKASVIEKETIIEESPKINIKKAGMKISVPVDLSLQQMKTVFEALAAV